MTEVLGHIKRAFASYCAYPGDRDEEREIFPWCYNIFITMYDFVLSDTKTDEMYLMYHSRML